MATLNDFQLEFTLKQHTPLIHFHDHEGATLRATELKPKLDKFIVEQLGGWDKVDKNWLIGKGKAEHKALDYKVTITANTKFDTIEKKESFRDNRTGDTKDRTVTFPNFFANIGEKDSTKLKIFSNSVGTVNISFFSMQPIVVEKVKSFFPKFISETNFGTRQTKGFGSFSILKDTPLVEPLLDNNTPFLTVKSLDNRDIFTVIDFYFKLLKSGVNYKGFYRKSYLFTFLEKEKVGYSWEKRWMKETFFGLKSNGTNKKFARALLGLAGSYTFKRTSEDNNPNADERIKVFDEMNIEVTDSLGEVTRIPSPILFKPVKYDNERLTKIYILTDEFSEDEKAILQGRQFDFKNRKTGHIAIPNAIFSIKQLVKDYNLSLGNQFVARDFSGKTINVEIKHTINHAR